MIAAVFALGLAFSPATPTPPPECSAGSVDVVQIHDGAPVDVDAILDAADVYTESRYGVVVNWRGRARGCVERRVEVDGIADASMFDDPRRAEVLAAAGLDFDEYALVIGPFSSCGVTVGRVAFVGLECTRPSVVAHETGHALAVGETEHEASRWSAAILESPHLVTPRERAMLAARLRWSYGR